VATGVKQKEIDKIIIKLKIKKYFKKIYGYPKKKENILRIIKQTEKVKYSSLYFIGDSISDLIAAQRRKVNFLGKKTNLNSKILKNNKFFSEENVYKLVKKIYDLNINNEYI
jgi:phosphoglycolate phosphatase-like HAD superfamily hydrolase